MNATETTITRQQIENQIKNLKWLLNRKNYDHRNMPGDEKFAEWGTQMEELKNELKNLENPTPEKKYYYRGLKHFNGKILKCAGCGAEDPKHRSFYEPYFSSNPPADLKHLWEESVYLPQCWILTGYHGDRITLEFAEANGERGVA